MREIRTPLTRETVLSLHASEQVLLSGTIYTARDAAHLRMMECLGKGEPLPFDVRGQVIYYAGPSPTPPGAVVGSIGPTTSTRMDAMTPALLREGLMGMIGKGERSGEVIRAMQEATAVYFVAIGGAAALGARCVRKLEVIAWDDLGPESVKRLEVEKLPLIVAIDACGKNAFEEGRKAYLDSCGAAVLSQKSGIQ